MIALKDNQLERTTTDKRSIARVSITVLNLEHATRLDQIVAGVARQKADYHI